jgi:ATP-dependent Clp protease protease subunit
MSEDNGQKGLMWLSPQFNLAAQPTAVYMPRLKIETAQGWEMEDPISVMYGERVIYLDGQVEDGMANAIVAQIMHLDSINSKDITLVINSPGGVVTAGLAIYDAMNDADSDISTVCTGQACSMGAFLLSAGEPGKRVVMPSARVMIHQPSGGAQGQVTDIEIHYREIQGMKDKLNKAMGGHCDMTGKEMENSTERDNFMSAEEAVAFGLADSVKTPKARAAFIPRAEMAARAAKAAKVATPKPVVN